MKSVFTCLFLLILSFPSARSQEGDVSILDHRHYSHVLGETRNYRIFLPPGYHRDTDKRYPVIYFYHGWSQRYFGITRGNGYDKGDDNGGDNIASYVADHEVIVVKPDGYNRNPDQEYYLRPYNVSPVETQRQYPIYFPELVDHIDARYRTIADREHRAISGLSMGGFMTFWIAGKYPQLLSAAGNFCGSTEFWVGPKDAPVEYRHIDMYKNYRGMNVRLNYGNEDFIRCYHLDMNKIWTQVMDQYEYKIYPAAHSTCGLGEMFDFLMLTFENPPAKPETWHHIDVYPVFSVWEYQITSDRTRPGFTILENVNKDGFRCSVREFLPDGEVMPFVGLTLLTPPVYEPNREYLVFDVDPERGLRSRKSILSDEKGRLKLLLDGGVHEIGISKKAALPNINIASWDISNMPWASPGKTVSVRVRLLNKGGSKAQGVTAKLVNNRESARVIQSSSSYGEMAVGEVKDPDAPFTFTVDVDSIEIERFWLHISDENRNQWKGFIDIPLMANGPVIREFTIADGRTFNVAESGDDTVSLFLGKGNGDGIANPGESIVILAGDPGMYRRTFLYTSDPFVNPGGMNTRFSDNWGSYDHVGGSAKYSVPLISSDCPDNHRLDFFAEYWLPDYPDHIIKRGKISIAVRGEDRTPPVLRWVQVHGDNTLEARIHDGGKIGYARAILTAGNETGKSFEVELNDEGLNGDRAAGDHVFSTKIPERKFGLYTVEIEAGDIYGNIGSDKDPQVIVLH